MSEEKKQPIYKIRINGGFSVAIFADTKTRQDGSSYIVYSAVLQKSWKDSNDEWKQQSVSMFDNNIMEIVGGLTQAFMAVNSIRNNLNKASTAPAKTDEAKQTEDGIEVKALDDIDMPY